MGQRFDLPPLAQIPGKLLEVRHSIAESRALNKHSKEQLRNYLIQINQIGGAIGDSISALEIYKWFIAKEKSLYMQLNLMKSGTNVYVGYFWSPDEEEYRIKEVL
jgi:hypothetical protein